MKIRKAKLEDCEAVGELAKAQELSDALGNFVPIEYFSKVVDKSDYFFIAEEDNKVVGFVLAESLLERILFVHLLGVDKSFRRQGIGRKLMTKLEQKAKEDNIS